jgi:hypothetical protein
MCAWPGPAMRSVPARTLRTSFFAMCLCVCAVSMYA